MAEKKYIEVQMLQARSFEGNRYRVGDKVFVESEVADAMEEMKVAKKTGETGSEKTKNSGGIVNNQKAGGIGVYEPRTETKGNVPGNEEKPMSGQNWADSEALTIKPEDKPEPSDEIEGVSPAEWPKPLTGGYYELSNNEKVKGKAKAIAAQKKVDEGKE